MTSSRGWIQTYGGHKVFPLALTADQIWFSDVAHHLSMECRFGGAVREFYSVAEHTFLGTMTMCLYNEIEAWTEAARLCPSGQDMSRLIEKIYTTRIPWQMDFGPSSGGKIFDGVSGAGNWLYFDSDAPALEIRMQLFVGHDITEYVLKDMPAPIKRDDEMEGYRNGETRATNPVLEAMRLEPSMAHWDAVHRADRAMLFVEHRNLLGHSAECADWGDDVPRDWIFTMCAEQVVSRWPMGLAPKTARGLLARLFMRLGLQCRKDDASGRKDRSALLEMAREPMPEIRQ